jgi:Zn-dependent protease
LSDINPGFIFIALVVLAFSLSFHEMAHAWTAYRLGDPTAYNEGRVSLNPVVHVDPIGTILFPLVGLLFAAAGTRVPLIGWAKPVPFSLRNLSRPRRDVILIALAGPASNILLAIVIAILWRLLAFVPPVDQSIGQPIAMFLVIGIYSNLGLAIFNLLPIPPLDGGKVLSNLLPLESGMAFDQFTGNYGFIILYALLLTGILTRIVSPPITFLASLLLT